MPARVLLCFCALFLFTAMSARAELPVDTSRLAVEPPPAARDLELQPLPEALLSSAKLQRAQELLATAFAKSDYPRAVTVADEISKALARQIGERDRLMIIPRTNYATALFRADRLAASIEAYQQAVLLAETSGNFRDPLLAPPLFGLGAALYRAGRYGDAIEALERAAFITRADAGLQNESQLAFDSVLMRSYVAAGRVQDAIDRQKVALEVREKALEPGPELDAARLAAARWFRILGDYHEEIDIHEDRAREIRREKGRSDPELAGVYQDLALALRREFEDDLLRLHYLKRRGQTGGFATTRASVFDATGPDFTSPFDQELLDLEQEAISLLRRAARIQKKDKNASAAEKAKTWILMGDHYTVIDEGRRGRRYYQRAWDALEKAGEKELLQDWLQQPVPIHRRALRPPQTNDPSVLAAFTGHASFTMDINMVGDVYNVELIEFSSTHAEMLRGRVVRRANSMIFRPRLEDRKPVTTKGHKYSFELIPAADKRRMNPNEVEFDEG